MSRVHVRVGMGWVLVFVVVIGAVALCGCKSATPLTFEQQMEKMQAVTAFARANDLSMTVQVTIDGDVGFYAKQQFGVDTGVTIQANLSGNAADGEVAAPTP